MSEHEEFGFWACAICEARFRVGGVVVTSNDAALILCGTCGEAFQLGQESRDAKVADVMDLGDWKAHQSGSEYHMSDDPTMHRNP